MPAQMVAAYDFKLPSPDVSLKSKRGLRSGSSREEKIYSPKLSEVSMEIPDSLLEAR